jgi:hypothetical protein
VREWFSKKPRTLVFEVKMDNWSFGISMTVVGIGGTFLTIAILIISINLVKKIFPLPEVHEHPERRKK